MIKHVFAGLLTVCITLGAGCQRVDQGPARAPLPAPADSTNDQVFGGSGDQASKVPADIPVYPGGIVIMVSGEGDRVSVAQDTPDASEKVIQWIKQELSQKGARLASSQKYTGSTDFVFQASDKVYRVRVDQPAEGGAYLTISREGSR